MKLYTYFLLLLIFVIYGEYSTLNAQCIPHTPFLPWYRVQGDLLCPDLSIPSDVTLLEFTVDGIVCPATDYIFTYPYSSDGYYKLEFHVNNSTAHVFSVCVRGSCGTGYYTGGFSSDGVTPEDCDSEHIFPAGYSAQLAHIVLKDAEITPTPIDVSTDTQSFRLILLCGFSFALLVLLRY